MLLSGRGASSKPGCSIRRPSSAAASVMLAVVLRWDRPGPLARALRKVPREFSIVGPPTPRRRSVARCRGRRTRARRCFSCQPTAAARLSPSAVAPRLLRPDEYRQLDNLPPILRGELRDACAYSPIATRVRRRPAGAFCYSGWETETPLGPQHRHARSYRRRGLGAAACTCLIRHFAALGKTAVWGSVDSNSAPALARKLGFTAVDRLMVFYPDDGTEPGSGRLLSGTRIGVRRSLTPGLLFLIPVLICAALSRACT